MTDLETTLVLALAGALVGCICIAYRHVRLLTRAASLAEGLTQVQGRRAELEATKLQLEVEQTELRRRVDDLGQGKSAIEAQLIGEQERRAADLEAFETRLEELRQGNSEKTQAIETYVAKRDSELGDRFKALAADCLKGANEALLQLAEERFKVQQQEGKADLSQRQEAVSKLVQPIAETLKKTDEKLGELQKGWTEDRSALREQIRALGSAGESLRLETQKLSRALSKPEVRGRYGELQLRRVAEIAGMVNYCDFAEQVSQRDDEGRLLRPDLIVKLPNERMIAVDAKCNIQAYVEAIEADTPEGRETCLGRFADHVVNQVKELGKKRYWHDFEGSPDFVVMFVPGDQFIDAALARRAELLDQAMQHGVILASPSTLIGLLRAVAVGWREKSVTDQAAKLLELGKELHERGAVALTHLSRLGDALATVEKRYNEFVGSYGTRLSTTLRRFEEQGVKSGKEPPDVAEIEIHIRPLELCADALTSLPARVIQVELPG